MQHKTATLIQSDKVRAIALSRTVATHERNQSSLFPPSVSVNYRGPSHGFLALTRNPALRSPVRFEPTVKNEGDIVL